MREKLSINRIKQYIQSHLMHYIQKNETSIKFVETIRGLYRYPTRMLGRKINIINKTSTDILVFAAHPDDDILGLGTTIYRHTLNGDNIKIVFVTNGSGRDAESWYITNKQANKKSETRYREATDALSFVGIPVDNVLCLGFPDGGTQRYLKDIAMDIQMLINKLNPGRIYVHCIEGGHGDHDLTSYVVKMVCEKMEYDNVYEWSEYNPIQALGAQDIRFLPSKLTNSEEIKIEITEEERIIKRKMLSYHQSQDVEQYYMQGEAIRKANLLQIEKELLEYCLLSKKRLLPAIKNFKRYIGLKEGHQVKNVNATRKSSNMKI